ncbi:MAG: PLP-dependent aspartate aminotransferase family protein [Clostridioides sp.]|nr:PLP-dependent aspartate aminotransferase family protein [Clostridioides sp.]
MQLKLNTKAIHGKRLKDQFGSVTVPVYRTSTFEFKDIEESGQRAEKFFNGDGGVFAYSRLGNPTTESLEYTLAELEKAESAVVTGSGIGAISSVMWTFLKQGDHVLADTALYGDTHGLFEKLLKKFGVEIDYVDFTDFELFQKSLKQNTAIVYFESPCNPTLKVNDIEKISTIAHEFNKDIKVVIDNTFPSPYLQNPITLGVDIVVCSMTKYLGGHSDIIGGAIFGSKKDMLEIRFVGIECATGSVLSPDNAFLVMRGIATLPVRMQRHCENAMKIAEYLEKSKYIKNVYYPGLKSNPYHEIAKKQMRNFGGMIAFETSLDFEKTKKFIDELKIVKLAVSLGGVESLIEHPASQTHHSLSEEELALAGISPTQVRMSVGIEDVEDLIDDLEQAFKKASM